MKFRIYPTLIAALAIYAAEVPLHAAYTIHQGQLVDVGEVPTRSVQEHYALGAKAIEQGDWPEAAVQFRIISVNFPTTAYGQDANFYLGVAYYHLAEFDFANEEFTEYLKCQSNPQFFEEVIEYKFAIAEKFAAGAKRRFLGTKRMPKWACGKEYALDIYDEVIAAVPCHQIAAQALVAKGYLLWCMKDYRGAVEAFQMVIRRFPRNELAPECYVLIAYVFLEQSKYEFQNPDILAYSEINYGRFQRDFPREERVAVVAQTVQDVKEIYANGLYETGQFYERTRHPRAAIIYYHNTIHQFPDTCVAELCRERLICLDATYSNPYVEDGAPENPAEELEEIEPRSRGVIEKKLEIMGA